jgi:DNA-directed RNA polymerase specialized sigma subunit
MSTKDKYIDKTTGEYCWKYGCTIKEIAIIMNCTENAVCQLLATAIKKLKENVQNEICNN